MPRINPHHPADSALPPGLTGASVAQARLHAWSVAAWRLGLEQVRKMDAEAATRLDRAIGNGVAHVTAVIDVQLATSAIPATTKKIDASLAPHIVLANLQNHRGPMRTANNIEQLYPALLEQLAAWKVDLDSRSPDWHASLRRAIQQGAFIRLHYVIGSAGVIDASIELVAPTGLESTPLSLVSVEHA